MVPLAQSKASWTWVLSNLPNAKGVSRSTLESRLTFFRTRGARNLPPPWGHKGGRRVRESPPWIWCQGSIQASPHRIAALASCEPPKTVRGLRAFVGSYKMLGRVLSGCAQFLASLESLTAGHQSQDTIVGSDNLLACFCSCQGGSDFQQINRSPQTWRSTLDRDWWVCQDEWPWCNPLHSPRPEAPPCRFLQR